MDNFTPVTPNADRDQSDSEENKDHGNVTSESIPVDDSVHQQNGILSPLLLNIEESESSRPEFLTPEESWSAQQDLEPCHTTDFSCNSDEIGNSVDHDLPNDQTWNRWQIYQPALQICHPTAYQERPEHYKPPFCTSTTSKLPEFSWFREGNEETPPSYDPGQYMASNSSHHGLAPSYVHQNHPPPCFSTLEPPLVSAFDPPQTNCTPNPFFTSPVTNNPFTVPKSSQGTENSDESTESSPSPLENQECVSNVEPNRTNSDFRLEDVFARGNYNVGNRNPTSLQHNYQFSPSVPFDFNWPNATHYRAKIYTRGYPQPYALNRANYHPFTNTMSPYYAYNSVPSLPQPTLPNQTLDFMVPRSTSQHPQQPSGSFAANGHDLHLPNIAYQGNQLGNFNYSPEPGKEVEFRCGICERLCSSIGGLKKHMQCCAASARIRQSMVMNRRQACQTVTSGEFQYDIGQNAEPSHERSSPFRGHVSLSMNFQPVENVSATPSPQEFVKEQPHDQCARLVCSVCDHVAFSAQSLLQHLSLHGEVEASKTQVHQCSTCGGQFQRLAQYQKHLRVSTACGAAPKDCFECQVCKIPYARRDSLRDHMRTHISSVRKLPSSSCPVCSKEVATSRLSSHLLSHTNGKTFVCEVCSKSFGSGGSLKKHARVHGAEKPFPCAVCGKGYASKDSLKGHRCVEMCGICFAKFPTLVNLQEHVSSQHPGIVTYQCPTCRKMFLEQDLLNQHISSAHKKPQRRFACSICTRTFASKGYLSKHEAGHRVEQTLACAKCKLTFMSRSSLVAHQALHEKVNYMNCPDCARTYLRKDGLERHLVSLHGYTRLVAKEKAAQVSKKEQNSDPSVPDTTVPPLTEDSGRVPVAGEELGPGSCNSLVVEESFVNSVESQDAKASQMDESVEEEQKREALCENVLQLLSASLGLPCLETFGWPHQPIHVILGSIVERLGITRESNAADESDVFRRDVRTLIELIVKDKHCLHEALRNRPLDLYVEAVVREMQSQKLRLQEHLAAAKAAKIEDKSHGEEDDDEEGSDGNAQGESQENEYSIP